MEEININNDNNDNNENDNDLDDQILLQKDLKECPFCNIIIPLLEFEDHIICHEIDQNENGNLSYNINGFGLKNNNNINNNNETPKQEYSKIFHDIYKKVDNFFNNNESNDKNKNNINHRNYNNYKFMCKRPRVKDKIFSEVTNYVKDLVNFKKEDNKDNKIIINDDKKDSINIENNLNSNISSNNDINNVSNNVNINSNNNDLIINSNLNEVEKKEDIEKKEDNNEINENILS